MYKLAKAEEQKAHLNELRKKSCWETVAPASYTERQNNTFIHWKDSFEAHYTKKAGLYNNEITFTLEDNMLKRLTVDSAGYVFCGKSNMKQIRRHINENAFITYKLLHFSVFHFNCGLTTQMTICICTAILMLKQILSKHWCQTAC